MTDVLLAVLTGVLVAAGTQQVTRRGRRWRALSDAKHELEVAGQLPPDDQLAARLEGRARERIEKYLRETPPEARRRWADLAGAALYLALGLASLAGILMSVGAIGLWVPVVGTLLGIVVGSINIKRSPS